MAEKGRKAYETNNGQSSAAAGPNWQALHRQGCLGKYHDYLESVTRFESGMSLTGPWLRTWSLGWHSRQVVGSWRNRAPRPLCLYGCAHEGNCGTWAPFSQLLAGNEASSSALPLVLLPWCAQSKRGYSNMDWNIWNYEPKQPPYKLITSGIIVTESWLTQVEEEEWWATGGSISGCPT